MVHRSSQFSTFLYNKRKKQSALDQTELLSYFYQVGAYNKVIQMICFEMCFLAGKRCRCRHARTFLTSLQIYISPKGFESKSPTNYSLFINRNLKLKSQTGLKLLFLNNFIG